MLSLVQQQACYHGAVAAKTTEYHGDFYGRDIGTLIKPEETLNKPRFIEAMTIKRANVLKKLRNQGK
jgi:hypothetical protein